MTVERAVGKRPPRAAIDVRLTDGPIDASEALEASPSDGAVVTFAGAVRGETAGHAVVGLEYEAYREMALPEMRRIAEEARRRFGAGAVRIVHRTGALAVGEVAVVISVAAPHRGEAFDACEFCIDTLKERVPIWKKERFEDGTATWVDHP